MTPPRLFLAIGALVLLSWTPVTVLDPGFQLSFAAVGAIFVGVPWLDEPVQALPLPRSWLLDPRHCQQF